MSNAYNANLYPTNLTRRVFVKKQSGVGVTPSFGAGDALLVISPPKLEQGAPMIEDAEIRNTLSPGDPIPGKFDVGSWELESYIKLPNALGVAPEGGLDALLEGLMGVRALVSSTSVTWSLKPISAGDMPWLSILAGDAIEGELATDCVVTSCEITRETAPTGDGSVFRAKFSGEFVRYRHAIVDQLGADIDVGTEDQVITVTNGKKFDVGMRVQINDDGTVDHNSNAGYLISAISGNDLSVSTAIAGDHTASSSVTIEPWLPASQTEVGTAVHAGRGLTTVDGNTADATGYSITIDTGTKLLVNIESLQDYPPGRQSRATRRQPVIKVSTYKRPGEPVASAWYNHRTGTPVAVNTKVVHPTANVGFYIEAPRCFSERPAPSGSDVIEFEMEYKPKKNSGNDNEVVLSLKAAA